MIEIIKFKFSMLILLKFTHLIEITKLKKKKKIIVREIIEKWMVLIFFNIILPQSQ